MRVRTLALALVAAVALASGSCMDPVHSKAVDDLGPEVAGVREGPTHRPGQPCTVCHGGDGPGSPDFVAAGTVYERAPDVKQPVEFVTVVLTDVRGATFSTYTNEVGNFYVTTREWSPTYPIFVALRGPDGFEKKMATPIGRDGGCAICHRSERPGEHPGDNAHMPIVGLRDSKDPK